MSEESRTQRINTKHKEGISAITTTGVDAEGRAVIMEKAATKQLAS